MKRGKKIFSMLMAVSLLLSSVCVTASADMTLIKVEPTIDEYGLYSESYYELQPDTSDTPEMPDVLKNRKPKHHYFERSDDHSINFRGELIMPGDTFEFQTDITREMIYTIDFYGRGDPYVHKERGEKECYFSKYSPENYGIEVTGSVDITGYDDYDSGDGTNLDGKHVTDKFIRTGKNNLNCPIIIGPTGGGGDGPYVFYPDHDQRRQHTDVCYTVLAPYYYLSYKFIQNENDYDYANFDNLFWPSGEFEDLEFPEYYWLTDKPYTLTIPNPTSPGRSFYRWRSDQPSLTYKNNDPTRTFKNNCTELTVQWTYDVATEVHEPYKYTYYDSDGEPIDIDSDNVSTVYRLPEEFEDVNIYGAGNMTFIPSIEGNKRTIMFYPNGGTINGRDKWLIEVNEVKREDEAKYGKNGDSRIPDDGDFGFDINDYIPEKPGDTFLGWCANEDTLYTAFVTKDSTIDAYRYFWEDDEYGTFTDKNCQKQLYAKWASQTDEAFEKNGWKLSDDGTLFIMNDKGAENWVKALKSDQTLATKVKDVKLGYKSEKVEYLPTKFLDGCTQITKLVFDDPVNFDNFAFDNCPNLTDVTLNFPAESVWISNLHYFGTNKDFTLHVPNEYYEDYKNALGEYAYLLNEPNTQRYPLTVNGNVISDNNLKVKCGDGTAKFDPKTNTLTLTNATLTSSIDPHFAHHYYEDTSTPDTPDNNHSINNHAIISLLDKLTIVIEGDVTVNTVVDNSFGSTHEEQPNFIYTEGDLEITGSGTLKAVKDDTSLYYKDNETMELREYIGPGQVKAWINGNLTVNDLTTERLYATVMGSFDGKNAKMYGGVIKAYGDVNADNLTVKDFNAPEGDLMLAQEIAYIISYGKGSMNFNNCDCEYTAIRGINQCKEINFTDSKISLAEMIDGGQDTKLNINNSDVFIVGGTDFLGNKMVTTISPENISLTNADIFGGDWTDIFIMIKPVENQKENILGDVNGDGKVTAKDSMLIQRFVINLEKLDNNQQKLADVDGNNKVTNADALSILRYTIKANVKYPIGQKTA